MREYRECNRGYRPFVGDDNPWERRHKILIVAGVMAAMAAAAAAMQAQAQSAQASAQSKAAQYNATVQRQQGQQAMEAATTKEAGAIRSNDAGLGQTAAGIAQSGIGIQSGSAQDVLRQNEINGQLDALNINYEGQLQKSTAAANAGQFDYQSQMAKANANNAMTQGYAGAGMALVGGAASGYAGYQNQQLIKQGIMPPGYSMNPYGSYGGGAGGIY